MSPSSCCRDRPGNPSQPHSWWQPSQSSSLMQAWRPVPTLCIAYAGAGPLPHTNRVSLRRPSSDMAPGRVLQCGATSHLQLAHLLCAPPWPLASDSRTTTHCIHSIPASFVYTMFSLAYIIFSYFVFGVYLHQPT